MNTAEPSDWMWVGKLAPPHIHVASVRREALLRRLQARPAGGLVLVVSPPGFGKTTLLTQWRDALAAREGHHVAWLSLEAADADPNRLLAYMIVALATAGIDAAALTQRARSQALDPDPQRNVAALMHAIESSGRRVTLILDDYHRAAGSVVDEVMIALLTRGAPWLDLVVASRVRPAWPLAKLRAQGLLDEIDAGDLVLSLSEASSILGPDFDRSALSVLHSRTEGWAVAVQLARLWFARGVGSSHGLQAMSGQVADIAEYLAEQVVETLAPACREFLIATSLLERFSAELADEARGRTDSAALLEQLAPYEALVVPLDASRTWFRQHLLLADYLRARLDARAARDVHRRAAVWLGRQSDWVLAVSHALQADDTALALSLLKSAGGWQLVLRKGIGYTQGLVRQFDEITRRTEPMLLLIQAYLHAKLGDEPLAMELLHLGEVALVGRNELRGDFVVISALVHVYFDRLDGAQRLPLTVDDAQAALPDDLLGQATLLCAGAVRGLALARLADTIDAARAARVRMRLAASSLGENYSLLHLAQALAASGAVVEARSTIDEALALAESNFGVDSSLKSLVGCFKAQHLYWQGHWAEALPMLREGARTIEEVDGWFDVFAATFEVWWRIALRHEGLSAALAVIDHAAALARRRHLGRLTRMVNLWRVDLSSQCNFLTQARQEAHAIGLESALDSMLATPASGVADWRYVEAGAIALTRLHLLAGSAREAVGTARRAIVWFSGSELELPIRRLELLILLAMRRVDAGAVAVEAPAGALDFAASNQLGGLLLEAGPGLLPTLRAAEGTLSVGLRPFVSELHGWHAHPPRQRAHFSSKEMEVLLLLAEGEGNKAIARALGVSENTVKFHLKNVFQKLGVDSRAAAIRAALQQGIARPV
jgi:LuxR family maltose regulon positive regulatory protein